MPRPPSTVRELRFIPANVQRRDDVIEQIGRDAAGVIPEFAEAEEAIRIKRPLGALPSHIFQSMKSSPFCPGPTPSSIL